MSQNTPDAVSGHAAVRIPSLFEIFFGKLANWFRQLAKWRKQGLLKKAMEAARRRRSVRLETLEPRVLLSADLAYGYSAGDILEFNDGDLQNNNYILDFASGAGNDEFRLRAESGEVLASGELNNDGINKITITGSEFLGDWLKVDLSGIAGQDATQYDIEVIFNGGGYLLGGDLLGQQDKVTVVGDGGYAMDSFSLTANAPGSFLLDGEDIAVVQSDAVIEVTGTIDAEEISLTANNTVTLDASGFGLASLKVTAMEVFANTRVTVGSGGQLIAGAGGITLSATANITTVATAESEAGGNSTLDAAIADTTIVSDVVVDVIGTGSLSATGGAVAMTASHTVSAQTTADGTAGGASNGAVLGVGVLVGTTEAAIEGTATVSGSNITLQATSVSTVETLAKAAQGGAGDDGNAGTSSETQNRLANPDDDAGTDDAAGTGEGNLSIAAALAVNDLTSTTHAFITSTGPITTAGALSVSASSTNVASAKADGSAAEGASTSVGIAVAINVGDVESKAYVAGGASISAASVDVTSMVADTSTFTAEAISGASDAEEVGVAGGLAINVVFVDSSATIEGGTVGVGGADLTLDAQSYTHSTAKATSAQSGDEATGIGASVALNISENSTRAAIENGVQLTGAGDLDMTAKADHEMTTEAKGGAAGGTAITPVAGITYSTHTTEVLLGTGSTLTLTGALDAQAEHTSKVETTAEGETQGSDVAVGASLALTIATDTVLATANRSVTSGGGATLQAHGASSSKADAKAAAKGAGEDDGSNPDGVDDQAGAQREGVNTQSQARGGSSSGTDTPSASTSEGSVSVAAAIAINIAEANSNASIADGTTIDAQGAFKLSAASNTDASASADGSATDAGDVGIGAAVAINKADVVNTATIGDATVTADGVTVEAVMRDLAGESSDKHTLEAKAKSGASGGDVGVAGSLALNMVNLTTEATIETSATVTIQDRNDGSTAVGASSIKAVSRAATNTTAEAEQEGGGDVGVGASVGLSIADATTRAAIENGAVVSGSGVSGGNLDIEAVSANDVTTTVKGGSGGDVALTPVVSIAIVHNTTEAFIGTGTTLTAAGALSVKASHEGAIVTKGEGAAEGGDVAVGASLALTYVEDTVEAKTLRNVTAGGAISFTAQSTASSRSEAVASAKGAAGEDDGGGGTEEETAQGQIDGQRNFGNQRASENGSSTSGAGGEATASTTDDPNTEGEDEGAVSVAAAIGVNIAKNTVRASIVDGLTISAGGTLTVGTGANVDAAGKADGSAVDPENSDVGIGAAVAINYVETINEARLGDATVTATGVTVDAAMLDREVKLDTASIPVVDTTENTIFLGLDHGLTTGQAVKYDDNGGTAIGGLNESDDYYVRTLEGGKIRLYTSEDAAKAGGNDTTVDDDDDDVVDLTGAGAGDGHKLKLTGLEGLFGDPVTFDTGDRRVLELDEGHGLHTGDKVTYHHGAGGTIGSLADGNEYYIIILDGEHAELAGSRADALAGKALTLGSNEIGNDDTLTERTHGYGAQATSGAGGGDVGIAGSVAVNIVNVDTDAVIANGATVSVSGAATKIAAEAVTHSTSKALPVDDGASGGVGIGASVAVNVVDVNTHATVQDSAALTGTASTLDVIATGDHLVTTDAQNGATAGDVGVAIAAGIAISENETTAHYGASSDLTVSNAANVKATHTGIVETKTGSKAKGADAAIGASVGVNYVDEDVSATVAGDIRGGTGATNVVSSATVKSSIYSEATAGGNSSDSNSADAEANNQTNNNSNTGGGRDLSEGSAQGGTESANESSTAESDTGSGGVGVAAAVSVNVMFVDNTAQVVNSGDIDRNGAVAVRAESEVDASAKAVGLAVDIQSESSMIGAAVGVNYANVHNTAAVGSNSLVKGNGVTVEAVTKGSERNEFVVWGAAAAGGGGDVSVAGSVGVNIVEFTTQASTSPNADLRSTGNLTVRAENDLGMQTIAAGAGFSTDGSAIGAAVAVAIVDADTTAILAGQADAADATLISAETDLAKMAFDIPMLDDDPEVTTVAVSGAAAAGDAAVAGSAAITIFDLTTDAHIAAGAQVNQRGGLIAADAQSVSVDADSHTDMVNIAGSLAVTSGSAGVGAGLDLGIIDKDTRAYIGANAQVDSTGAVIVDADSSEGIVSAAANAGVGSDAGIAVTASVYVMDTGTRAYLDSGASSEVDADGTLTISATGDFALTQVAGAVGAAGTAGIGAAAAVLVHDDTVEAYVGDATVDAGALVVAADSSEDIISISAAGGVGGTVGVSGAASVLALNENTTARVARGASVTTADDVAVGAHDETFIVSVAGSLAGAGTAAVGVGADVGVVTKNTTAFIDSRTEIDAGGDILVSATSSDDITSVAAGLAASGGASVAIDASVHVLNVTTRAYIGEDPADGTTGLLTDSVHADGNVIVSADAQTEIDKVVGVLAVGLYAGIGAAGGVNVINKTTEAYIGDDANVSADGAGAAATVATGHFTADADSATSFDPSSPEGQGIEANDASATTGSGSYRSEGEINAPDLGVMDAKQDGGDDTRVDPTKQRIAVAGEKSGFRGVAVTATNQDDVESFTMSLAGGIAGVAVSAGVNVVNADTSAYVGDASVDSGESVHVASGSDFYELAVAGTLAAGVVGVAPAVGVTVVGNTTESFIANGASVTADNDVTVEAHNSEDVMLIGFGIAGGLVGVGGAVGVLTITNETSAYIGDASVSAGGDVLVYATDDTKVDEISGALAGGFVGIGASVGVMVIDKDTEAYIADGAVVNALGTGTGIAGVLDGTIDQNVEGDDEGFGTGTVHGLVVQAQSSEDVFHLSAAGGAGFVGVSGAVTVTLVDSDTSARIGNADINQGGNAGADSDQSVWVNASNEVRITSFAGAVAGGFVGVGGAVDVGGIRNDTSARILAGAEVTALNDVSVNSLGITELDGFTFSGAGGVVGLSASVSVWSVGKPLEKNYSNNDGESANALEGENGSADADAVGQAESGRDEVSGQLGGVGQADNADGKKSFQERMKGGTTAGTNGVNSAPGSATLQGKINAVTPTNGTEASIAGSVEAGDDINVLAKQDVEADMIVGGVSGGLVGVGASVAVVSAAANTRASATGNLSAGGTISVKAQLDEDVNATALSGSVGFVGLGAAVVVINDASVTEAGISGANIPEAGSISVVADSNQSFHGLTGQVSIGAVGAGASFVTISVDNDSATDTRAFISGSNIGVGAGTVGSVSVSASSVIDAYAETYAISGGIGAMSGNFAIVEVTPEVSATAAGTFDISGALNVSATATPSARAETFGVAIGVGLGAGFSLADAEASPTVTASVAGSIVAGSLSVQARQLVPVGGHTAYAQTIGSSGGLVSVDATVSNATNNGAVRASVVNGATLTIANSTTVSATNNTKQKADANSNSFGLVAGGVSRSDASSSTVTEAFLGSNVKLTGKSLIITANGTDDNFADTVAGSAGAIAGASASADSNSTSNTTAEIRNRTQAGRTIVLTEGSGALNITAEHTTKPNGRVQAFAGGLFAGLGADVENDVTSNVTARVGADAIVTAKDVEIRAVNHINKQFLGTGNIEGTTGGFISGGGGDSDTLLNLTTLVDIGDNAAITVVGSVATPGDLTLSTLNDIVAKDKVVFTVGGAFSGLSANSRIETPTNISRVQIGSGADLQNTVGEVNISARGQGNVQTLVEAEAYGAATYTAADSTAKVTPHNEIFVGANAHILAKKNLNLSTGTDVNFHRDQYTMDARSDTFAGSAIPIDDVDSTTLLITENTITIAGGAVVETAGTARLHADRMGFADLSGSAKAVSWISAAQDFLNGAAAAEMNDATIHQEAHGTVHVDGTVRTGIERHKELILTGWDNATGTITEWTQVGGVTFTSGPEAVESDLIAELDFARKQLNLYGDLNETLRNFYQGEIDRLEALIAAEGMVDPVSGQPTLQYAITVHVDAMTAEAGRIDIRTDQLQGSGVFDAPGDASVNIQNHTPAFLKLHGIVIPESNGGLALNGVPVTLNSQITTSNVNSANADNSNNVAGELIIAPGAATFAPLPDNEDSTPTITVDNDFFAGPQGGGITYPWPDIVVLGKISNLGGSVTLQTLAAGEGDIVMYAPVEAEELHIIAGGTVFIDLSNIPNSVYPVGGVPYAIWGDITEGTVPGDDSGTLYEGLGAADPAAIAALLATMPSQVSLYGDRIYIDAEYIDINGIMQSGKDVYQLEIGADTIEEIDDIPAGSDILVPLLTASNDDFIVRYNTDTGQLEVDEKRNEGGYIDLTGHILNSGNGLIRVLGGYAEFEIDNNTPYDLVINRLDNSQPGEGTLIIKDKAKGSVTNPYVTLYEQNAGGAVQRTEDDGAGGAATVVTPDVGTTSTYTPSDGWRFGWTVGVETKDYFYHHSHVKAWLDIDWLAADPADVDWQTHEVLDEPMVLEDGPYYFKDASVTDAYTFSYPGAQELEGKFYIIDQKSETSWYGTTTYHKEVAYESRNLHLFTHTIESDRPVAVEFIGADKGTVDVESDGDVVLRGPVLNPTGTTRIATDGAIVQAGDEALVSGRRIELSAGNGVGSASAPLRTDVSVGAGASLMAETDSGQIHIHEVFGSLPVDRVVSEHDAFGSGGKVSLTSQGSIVAAQNAVGDWYDGKVEGGGITLTANGGIGSSAHNIVLDSGSFLWDKVNVEAAGSVYLTEQSGDLHVESIFSTHDVHITVLDGGVVDANEVEVRDERTYEELKGGVWHDLQLTDTTGGADKVQEAKDTFADIREQEYRAYWDFRMSQPHDPLVAVQAGSLVAGARYYVIVDGTTVRLAASVEDAMAGKAIDLDAAGTGSGQGLSSGSISFSAVTNVNDLQDSITLPGHGFTSGDAVAYSAQGDDENIGLAEGVTYYVDVVDADTIRLKANPADADAIVLSPTSGAALHSLYRLRLIDPAVAGDSVDLGAGHGLVTGDAVVYSLGSGDTAIGTRQEAALEDGQTLYVILDGTDKVKLSLTEGGPALDLNSLGASGVLQQLSTGIAGEGLFDPSADVDDAADTIFLGGGHGLADGQAVTYRPLVYDAEFDVSLTESEEAYYRSTLGYDDAGIAALEESRTQQYHTLHAQYGSYGDVFDGDFEYSLTADEIAAIEGSIHIYTEQELLYAISAGLLEDIADTQVTQEDPNIVAPSIFITTSDGVGNASDQLTLDVTGGAADLSDDERVALAAAERADIAYLGETHAATVNFNAASDTITRTDGGSWIDDGFAEGMRVHVQGSAANSTTVGEFYVVEAVSNGVLTLSSSAELVSESGVAVTVAAEVSDPMAGGSSIKTILIDQREDVDVEINSPLGRIDVTAHDSVYIGSEETDLRLGRIQTDTSDAVRLKSGQGIVNSNAFVTNVIGGHTVLEAASGSIGSAANPIQLDLGADATITARASGSIYMVEQAGNMNVETMFAESGEIVLTAQGSIVDALNTDFTKMAASNFVLTAQTGTIGESGDYLEIDAFSSGTLVADAHGSIWLRETFGNMNVEHVQSDTADVDLKASIAILDALGTGAADVIGNNITLTAEIGGIGLAAHELEIDSAFSAPGTLTSSSALAHTYIVETDGDLSLNQVGTGAAFTAFITAPDGSILNGRLSGPNVVSGRAYLVASDDIGASLKPLLTELGNIEGKSITGSTWVTNDGDLEEGGVIVTGEPGMTGGGSAEVIAESPIDAIEDVTYDSYVEFMATDSAGAGDDLTLHANVDFVSNDSYVELRAGDDLTIDAAATVTAETEIRLYGDYGNADAGVGSTITVSGTLSAARIIINGSADDDIIYIDGSLFASEWIEIHGGGGEDTILITGTFNAPEIRLYGTDGEDVITIDVDHPANSITGHVEIFGGDGEDLITIDRLHSRASSVDIDGQGSTDDVVINVRSDRTDYVINVTDSGAQNDGADTLTINGTEELDALNPSGEDVFLLRSNFVAYLSPDSGPEDLFPEVERINYDDSINGRLTISGHSGNDRFHSDDNSAITTLDGGAGEDFFQFGQVFGADRVAPQVAGGDEIETVDTTLGFLSIGTSFAATAYGGDGDDKFSVYSNKAPLKLFGEGGNDEFVVRAFIIDGTDDLASTDTEVSGGEGDDNVHYNINAPVSIDGGAGADTVVVIGTEADDNFVITKDGVQGAGLNVDFVHVEKLEVDGMEGNDHFFVLSTNHKLVTTIIGGLGSDTFDVGGDVTDDIVALSVEGRSGFINHGVTSDDPAFDGIFAEGVPLNVADGSTGTVMIDGADGLVLVEDNAAADTDSYTVRLAVPVPVTPTIAYLTVSAALASQKDASSGGKSAQVSITDVDAAFDDALVLTFDSSATITDGDTSDDHIAWDRIQTVFVKASSDDAQEGERTVVVSHSIQSDNDDFDRLAIANVEAQLIDNDKAGLVVKQSGVGTTVVEGIASDEYTVALTRAPEAGEEVTVTLGFDGDEISAPATLVFNSDNWSTAQTVTVEAAHDTVPENTLERTITHSVTSTGGVYGSVAETFDVEVQVRDNDSGGLVVTPSDGTTLVSEGVDDTYTIQLTQKPTHDVFVSILTDGKTIVSSDDARFIDLDPNDGIAPVAHFTNENWDDPFTVRVSVNPDAEGDSGSQPVQSFPAQPHNVSQISGPLVIEGSLIPGKDRSIKPAVMLPTEIDVPLPVLEIDVDESQQTDTLNIFNDGSLSSDAGSLGLVDADQTNGLEAVYEVNPGALDAAEFGYVAGLRMGEGLDPLDVDFGSSASEDVRSFERGIVFHGVEVVDVLLGQNNDVFAVTGTVQGAITLVQGGGGDDTITITGGGGADAPLVVFGDSSQDGSFHNSTTESVTAYLNDETEVVPFARAFTNPGNDVIDASASTLGVTIYGGSGNDTIHGSQGGDHLAGGSGDDTIHGEGGVDHIYGDSGVNIDLSTRLDLADDVISIVNLPAGSDEPTGDALVAGEDTVHGNAGDDVIFGDYGVITQTEATQRILTTGNVEQVETVNPTLGAADTIEGNEGVDHILGGQAGDTIRGGDGDDIILGDHGVFRFDVDGDLSTLDTVTTTDRTLGGSDTVRGEAGDDVLVGGAFGDKIDGGSGRDVVFGDNVALDRTIGSALNPRFRELSGDEIYSTATATAGGVLVTGASQLNPAGTPSWEDLGIELLDHTATSPAGSYGDDEIAGGADGDQIFGQLGNDNIEGDGSIDAVPFEADSDGDDYIEGNGGNDTIYGNLGQDDLIGGSSSLFSLDAAERLDGADIIFGGDGSRAGRNDPGTEHGRDADMILGDNGNIYRIVGTAGFAYDDDYAEQIVVRAAELLDYTPGGPDLVPGSADIGGDDELHGESGDDAIYGMTGDDVMFGDGQDDDLIGGWGHDWISGGDGQDGILGDDGRIFTSRNGVAEPLYGIVETTQSFISTPGGAQQANLNVDGELKKSVDLTPFNPVPGNDELADPQYADDIIYGGLGSDFLHGGAGDDAISGAEALPQFYANPSNAGDVLAYDEATTKFAQYDANDPLRKVMVDDQQWLLNFDALEGPLDTKWAPAGGVATDGDDAIFGDLGNDWLVGGTGRDKMFGGWGDDLLNGDDQHDTNAGANNGTDTNASYEDFAYGGAGRDVLIANTGGDRLVDWAGEFNSYVVPFSPFGMPAVSRTVQPGLYEFLYALSESSGADQTRAADAGTDDARNGEPFGELGLVKQGDAAWGDQHGGPRDPQPGNGKASRDVRVSSGDAPIQMVASDLPDPDGTLDLAPLSQADLDPIVAAAVQRWIEVLGADSERVALLDGLSVSVSELPGIELAQTTGTQIVVSANAAGHGWFVDITPADGAEFAIELERDTLVASADSAAHGHMDLVTVVTHEIGHVLGFDHRDAAKFAVMDEDLEPGVRYVLERLDFDSLPDEGLSDASLLRLAAQAASMEVPAAPAFDLGQGHGLQKGKVDWQSDCVDSWAASSPFATKGAKHQTNVSDYIVKPAAEYDSLGKSLSGAKRTTK